jgi:Na+-driven multidrug efflux pump
VLDLFCILTLGWGVAGAAIATVFSQGLSALLCYIYMYRKFDILKTEPADRRFRGDLARQLLYIGVPMGLQFSITAIGSIMLQSANNALGTACVAAFTAAMRIKMFVMCPLDSLGMAMATYSGQNYGAGKPDRIWMGIKSATLMMTVYVIAIGALMWGLAEKFALLFISPDETEIIDDTALFLHINTSFFFLLGKQLVVPKSAVVLRSGKQVVFTLTEDKAYWNYVHTGLENADSYTIIDGLKEGDIVITSGNINLAHEAPVKVIDN